MVIIAQSGYNLTRNFVILGTMQDFLNVFFRDKYKPIPSNYNLVLAMLWRHPENIELEKVKVVHYCANVSNTTHLVRHDHRFNLILQQVTNVLNLFLRLGF